MKNSIQLMESMGLMPKNFLKEIFNRGANNSPMPLLTEITVNRLLGKHYNSGFAIVSASRFKNTNQENNQLTKELFLKLKNSNYSYIPVFGGFIENKGSENEQHVYEKSFLILNYNKEGEELPFQDLKNFALEICSEYNQDSVLLKSPNGQPQTITKDGDLDMEFSGDIKINDLTQEYFTSFVKTRNVDKDNQDKRKQSRLTFEGVYINPPPETYSERHARYLSGEIFLK
jgi:hypothetical protein